jgi:hypothetical protein
VEKEKKRKALQGKAVNQYLLVLETIGGQFAGWGLADVQPLPFFLRLAGGQFLQHQETLLLCDSEKSIPLSGVSLATCIVGGGQDRL